MFHECVDFSSYQSLQKLTLIPPIGEFEVMNYWIKNHFDIPFSLTSFLKQDSPYKIEFEINLRNLIDPKLDAKIVEIRFSVPQQASSVKPELDPADKNKLGIFHSDNREVHWTIHKMKG